ncbi:hypothetical protein LSAT2_018039 [Lamellibrachia satsuma]|nr:hypothetical protein LSAT2_018039 [Lamellibrachia satsuma]
MATINYYAEKVAAKEKLPATYKDLADDPHQLGGDLVLDSAGQIVYIYCSQQPPDRPDVDILLDIMRTENKRE